MEHSHKEGNKMKIKLGTREQNILGNKNITFDKILSGNEGTQRKFYWEQGNTNPPGGPINQNTLRR